MSGSEILDPKDLLKIIALTVTKTTDHNPRFTIPSEAQMVKIRVSQDPFAFQFD